MAEKTEELVSACVKAASACQGALATAETELGALESLLKRLDRLGRDGDPDVGAPLVNDALEQKGITIAALAELERALPPLEKAAKELGSKLKAKAFLALFKTQRSLADAKVSLAATQEAAKGAKKKLGLMRRHLAKLDDRLTMHFGQLAENRATRPAVQALEAWRDGALREHAKAVSKILVVLKGREAEFKKLRARFDKTAGWDARTRDALADEVRDLAAYVGDRGLQKQITALMGQVRSGFETIDLGRDRSAPSLRDALKKTLALKKKVDDAIEDAFERSQDLTGEAGDLLEDLDALQVGLGGGDDRLRRARDAMERLVTMAEDSPTFEVFAGTLDVFARWTPFLTKAVKDPTKLDDAGWRTFSEIETSLGDERAQAKATWRQLQRLGRQAEALAKRHAGDDDVAALVVRLRAALAKRNKEHTAFQKSLPLVEKHVKRLASFRP